MVTFFSGKTLKDKRDEFNEKYGIDNEEVKPVNQEDIENIIKIVDIASKINIPFNLTLKLKIGELKVSESSYVNMKMVTSKKEEPKLLIQHKNMLLSNDTYIETDNIIRIIFSAKFDTLGDDINV